MFLVWTSNHHSIQKLTAQINTILLWQQFGHIRFGKVCVFPRKPETKESEGWKVPVRRWHKVGEGDGSSSDLRRQGSKSSCSQQDSQQHQPAHPSWGGWRPLWWPNPAQTVMTSAWLWYLPPVVTSTSRAHTAAGWQAAPQRQQIAWIHGCKHTLKQLLHDEKHKKQAYLPAHVTCYHTAAQLAASPQRPHLRVPAAPLWGRGSSLRGASPQPSQRSPLNPAGGLPQTCCDRGTRPSLNSLSYLFAQVLAMQAGTGRSHHSWRFFGRLTKTEGAASACHVAAGEGSEYLTRGSRWTQSESSSKEPAPSPSSSHPAGLLLQPGRHKAALAATRSSSGSAEEVSFWREAGAPP